MVTLDRWGWVTIASLAVAFVSSVIATPVETAIARGFFVITVVGGIVAGAGLRGSRTQATVAIIASGLVLGQRAQGGHPVADPPSPDWRVALTSPDDAATVQMRLDEPGFRAVASRADSAWVYVCAEGIGGRDSGLVLDLRTDRTTVTVEFATKDAVGARSRPGQGGMYRAPIDLEVLRQASIATLSLRAPHVQYTPVRICGTHSIRPSWGEATSVLIRGGVASAPSPKGPGRWVIELRLVDPDDRLLLAWY
jgi:hypothetical protein